MIACTLNDLQLLKSKINAAMQFADRELELPTANVRLHLYEAFRLVDIKERRLVKNLRKRGEKRK